MADQNKIYVDACPFIDMAKFQAKMELAPTPDKKAERQRDVWVLGRLLIASRATAVRVFTSTITVAECNHLGISTQPVPDPLTQRFFSELLTSGKSGVYLVQTVQAILEQSRDLRWKRSIFFKPMDSIHVATALHLRCKEILTHDGDIHARKDQLAALGLSVAHPRNSALLPEAFAQSTFEEPMPRQE